MPTVMKNRPSKGPRRLDVGFELMPEFRIREQRAREGA
jgi:hypothetical protein